MKNMVGKLTKKLALVMASLLVVAGVSACGLLDWNESKAKEYVTSALDANIKGEFKAHAKITGQTEKQLKAEYDKRVGEDLKGLGDTFDKESQAELVNITKSLGKKAKYDVTSAKKTDKGFTVTVTYEPLTVFTGLNEKLVKQITPEAIEKAGLDTADNAAMTKWVTGITLDLMKEGVQNPTYAEKKTMTVKITKKSNKYILSDADMSKLINGVLLNN